MCNLRSAKCVIKGEGVKGGGDVEDLQIVELFFERNEEALRLTEEKYSRYCHYVANNILESQRDSEEIVNDTLLRAWNSIPPAKPDCLKAFLGKIARNLALDKYDKNHAQKRNSGVDLAYEELSELIPAPTDGSAVDTLALKTALNGFLRSLKPDKRIIFMQRYWYLSSVKEIAKRNGLSEANIKITLMRLRAKFKTYLEKEGIKI